MEQKMDNIVEESFYRQLKLTVEKGVGFGVNFTYENGIIHSNKAPDRWLPVILGKPLESNLWFSVECLQKPVKFMVGIVSEA